MRTRACRCLGRGLPEGLARARLEVYGGSLSLSLCMSGSGKTHSIMGVADDPGILPRSLAEFFDCVNDPSLRKEEEQEVKRKQQGEEGGAGGEGSADVEDKAEGGGGGNGEDAAAENTVRAPRASPPAPPPSFLLSVFRTGAFSSSLSSLRFLSLSVCLLLQLARVLSSAFPPECLCFVFWGVSCVFLGFRLEFPAGSLRRRRVPRWRHLAVPARVGGAARSPLAVPFCRHACWEVFLLVVVFRERGSL